MTREEAIAWLEDEKGYYEMNPLQDNDKGSTAYQMAIEALKQPEQKKGKWIVTGTFFDFLKCSCCGYKTPWNQDVFNFCPKCGAEMEGEE